MEFDLKQPLPTPASYSTCHHSNFNDTSHIFNIESQHMPSNLLDIDIFFRQQAISVIFNLSSQNNVDPFISYLAINYLDRFLSVQPIQEGKPWMSKLLAVSLVSIAIKMSKSELSVTSIQRDSLFDKQTIRRMELLILGALKWRMRSITPLSFINFFVAFFKVQDATMTRALTARATEIIFKSQSEIKILEFKPSVVAASALLSACHELFPLQFPCLQEAILMCSYVNKVNCEKCNELLQEIAMDGYKSAFDTVNNTPVNVLGRRQLSSLGLNRDTVTNNATGYVQMGKCKQRKVGSDEMSQIEQCQLIRARERDRDKSGPITTECNEW